MLIFCAAPARALPSAKENIDKSMMGLRPNMSARAPESGRMAVLERAYADPTHVKSSPPLRSLVIVGRAVATAVRSRALRRIDMTMATNDSQKAAPLPAFAGVISGSSLVGDEGGRDGVDIDERREVCALRET